MPARPRLHLHVQPCFESRSAGADLADSGAHLGFHEALADGIARSGHRLSHGRIHRRGSQRQRSRRKESVAAAERVLAKGVHITTFVEGTRSPDGRMLPFKKGPFFLAMETGAPCIPVSIHGTEKIMGKGSLRMHPGHGACSLSCADRPCRLCHARGTDAGGARGDCFRTAGVDANIEIASRRTTLALASRSRRILAL